MLNIVGLSIGMICFILIATYIIDELRYDRCHKNADKIYRVIQKNQFNQGEPEKSAR